MERARDILTWRPGYFGLGLGLLGALTGIALFVRDGFVRPFLGDVLAVVWVYVMARAVFALSWPRALAGALALAFGLELAQYVDLLARLGLQDHRLARVVLGATFDVLDLMAYAVGAALVGGVEVARSRASRGGER